MLDAILPHELCRTILVKHGPVISETTALESLC